jgi:hypothetical protein
MVPYLGLDLDLPFLEYLFCWMIKTIMTLKAGHFVIREETLRVKLSLLIPKVVKDDIEAGSMQVEKGYQDTYSWHFSFSLLPSNP